ncbi:MAG: dTDP-4-dehydrorhamnose reductase [Oxalobacteraceae bacterium]|nr:dTDP-4-dehydrorhamnose reductase [Oxalobacteraceae bacterium]
MRILVLGRRGQVGAALAQSLQGLGELVTLDRAQLDLSNSDVIRTALRELQPQMIINAAAYTAVDAAESDAATAFQINAEAPRVIAEESERLGAALIHYSTDYVFDGGKQGAWLEDDAPAPLSVYGHSKLAGEQAITDVGGNHLILRTSWVYGLHGKNFLLTMLKLAETRDELAIVDDQIGAPTWAVTIADATAAIIRDAGEPAQLAALSGIYHLCAGGHTSWFGFAQAIFAHASVQRKPKLRPITTAEYPTPAKRPSNSMLNTDKFRHTFGDLPAWDDALQTCMQLRVS